MTVHNFLNRESHSPPPIPHDDPPHRHHTAPAGPACSPRGNGEGIGSYSGRTCVSHRLGWLCQTVADQEPGGQGAERRGRGWEFGAQLNCQARRHHNSRAAFSLAIPVRSSRANVATAYRALLSGIDQRRLTA